MLKALGVRVELDIVKGADHVLWDPEKAPALAKGAEEAQERAMIFLARELL